MIGSEQAIRAARQRGEDLKVLVRPVAVSKGLDRRVSDAGFTSEGGEAMSLSRFSHVRGHGGDRVHADQITSYRNLGKPYYGTSHFSCSSLGANPCGMSDKIDQRREAFRAFVKAQGGVSAVARASEVPGSTLYSYLDKNPRTNQLGIETLRAVATAYGVSVEELFGATAPRRQVPVAYYVGAGAEVQAYADNQGPFDFVDAPADASLSTVAGRIDGVSLGRILDQAVVFWDDVRSPVTTDQHGRLCVVELHDGRVLVKEVHPSRTAGLFHLFSETEQPILDVPLVWAAVVTNIRPR